MLAVLLKRTNIQRLNRGVDMAKNNKPDAGSAPPLVGGALIPPADGSAPPPSNEEEAADVTVRVLVSTVVGDSIYQPNQLVQFTADVYTSLDKARFDDSEAAVAYCESIGSVVVIHEGKRGE